MGEWRTRERGMGEWITRERGVGSGELERDGGVEN